MGHGFKFARCEWPFWDPTCGPYPVGNVTLCQHFLDLACVDCRKIHVLYVFLRFSWEDLSLPGLETTPQCVSWLFEQHVSYSFRMAVDVMDELKPPASNWSAKQTIRRHSPMKATTACSDKCTHNFSSYALFFLISQEWSHNSHRFNSIIRVCFSSAGKCLVAGWLCAPPWRCLVEQHQGLKEKKIHLTSWKNGLESDYPGLIEMSCIRMCI